MIGRLLAVALAFSIAACSSSGQSSAKNKENPNTILMDKKRDLNSKGVVAEVASSKSGDLQMAREKVEQASRAQLARSLEAKVTTLQSQFKEEAGEEFLEHFKSVSKTVTSRVLNGTTLSDFEYVEQEGGKYEGWGLMIMDPKLFRDALAEEMNADKAMKTRFMATKAYEELDKEVAQYENFKKENTPSAQ